MDSSDREEFLQVLNGLAAIKRVDITKEAYELSLEIFPVQFVATADRSSDLSVGLPKLILHTTTPLKCPLQEGQRPLFLSDDSFWIGSVILTKYSITPWPYVSSALVGAFFVGSN